MRGAPRRRRGGGSRRWETVVLLAVVAGVLAAATVGPVASFGVASVDRPSDVAVVGDTNATVGLGPAASVSAGTSGRVLAVTNRFGERLAVTVALVDGSGGDATLAMAGERGDSVTAALAAGESVRVDASVDCDAAPLHVAVGATSGSFELDAARVVDVTGGCSDETARPLVYANANGVLSTLAGPDGTPETYGVQPAVIGPASVDFDGDGASAIPYSPDGSTLALTDGDGGRTLNGTLYGTPSRLWAGAWNGSDTALHYPQASSKDVYRVAPGGTPERAVVTKAKAVVGRADVDGDGASELLFVGGSQQIRIAFRDGSTAKSSASAATTNAVGSPADFDGDGTRRVPLVDGSNNVQLAEIDASGSVTETKIAGGAAKTGVAALDWDGDGTPEVLYVGNANAHLHYVDDVASDPTAHTVTVNGSAITVDRATGVA